MKPIAVIGLFASGALFGAVLGAAGLALAQGSFPAMSGRQESRTLGAIDLGAEFPAMAGYALTLRTTTVAPGAGHAMHSHKGAPEIIAIVSGVLSDQRGGKITTHGPGDVLINDSGVSNAVFNAGAQPVLYYAATVGPPPKAPDAP
jgi:quercetin dioxygenase-like cupin family protein